MIQLILGVAVLSLGVASVALLARRAVSDGVFTRADALRALGSFLFLAGFWLLCRMFESSATPPAVDQVAHEALGCPPGAWAIALIKCLTPLGDWKNHLLVLAVLALVCKRWPVRRGVLLVLVAFLGTGISTWAFKAPLGRLRPPDAIADHADLSYPSGHAACSLVFFFGIAPLLARQERARRWPVRGIATAIAILVGYSRLYLRAHWLTDVVGAWCLGAFWLSLASLAASMARRSPSLTPYWDGPVEPV